MGRKWKKRKDSARNREKVEEMGEKVEEKERRRKKWRESGRNMKKLEQKEI